MTLEDAKAVLDSGAFFGTVYPMVAESDRDALKAYFCSGAGGPPTRIPAASPPKPNGHAKKPPRVAESTGDLCGKCGGLMVRTGTCTTCQFCGESSGGCG